MISFLQFKYHYIDMRILWFSVTPSLFNPHSNSFNGGGWIASLEKIVRTSSEIDLGVAFDFQDPVFKYVYEGVTYYPILSNKQSRIKQWFNKSGKENKQNQYLKIIDDFKPDLIQIFGSENDFGMICRCTKIPVVIHMQGCLPPYHNALFPIGMNSFDFLFHRGLSLSRRIIGLRSEPAFNKRATQEISTVQNCQYFMGRTEWDKNLIHLFNPNATYFHCEEALRSSFLNNGKQWVLQDSNKVKIVSVISNPWYKGVDLILKTGKLLKQFTNLEFEWQIYGVQDINFYEHKYKIKAADVNVRVIGVASKDELVNALCKSTCYVHPSYIDNSPNSLCEAQILGVPVLATHVGGISSLIEDCVTGILYPANDPYTLASLIKRIKADKKLALSLSQNARIRALERHNPDTIRINLIDIYRRILEGKKR